MAPLLPFRIACVIVGIVSLTALTVADTCSAGGTPEGLTASDWKQIRGEVESERYRAKWVEATPIAGVDSALYANNLEQQLHSYFSAGGLNVLPHESAATWRFGMRLVRWGWNGELKTVTAVAPDGNGNRIEYRRGNLTEWFVNDRSGLEQGFTVVEPPDDHGFSTLQLEMEVSGRLRPTPTQEGDFIEMTDEDDEPVLRYAGLRAWDTESRSLEASLSVTGKIVRITVEATGAVFPITVDPTLTQVAVLYPTRDPDAQDEAHFGIAVAVDGDTAVVGAPGADGPLWFEGGAAYVFARSGSTWIQRIILEPPFGGGSQFGTSVAVDGDRIVVGDPAAEAGEGRVYVFVRSGPLWDNEDVISAGDAAADDAFGTSVAIDGDTIVVGAAYDDHAGGENAGSAYAFTWSGTSWDQQVKLIATDAATGDRFGDSVAISGNTAIVGALFHDHVIGNAGAAYVFVRSGTSWTDEAELLASDRGIGDFFGGSVAIDGDTAVVGAEWDDHAFTAAGSAYVFERFGTTWSEQVKLVASDAAFTDRFGMSVSIEGDTAVVGSHYDNHSSLSDPGSAYVFVRSGTVWTEQAMLAGGTLDNGDRMGISVALSGETVFAGASRDDHNGVTDAGSAYAFFRSGAIWSEQQYLTPTDGADWDFFGRSIDLSGDTMVVGAPTDRLPGVRAAGSARVFVRSGEDWTEQARLVAADGENGDYFGNSVAIDGDTIAVGAPSDDHGGHSDTGSVYVFVRSGTVWSVQQKLVAADADHGDAFGESADIDGDTVIVGADLTTNGGVLDGGSAYVFTRSGTVWSEQQELIASDAAGFDWFGSSVAIDGDMAVIGARRADHPAVPNCGAAYVFTRVGSTWIEETKLLAFGSAEDDKYGSSVAIEGDRVAVGAPYDDHAAGINAGSVSVHQQSGAVWLYLGKIEPADAIENEGFGSSVSLWQDWLAVGTYTVSYEPARVYLYTEEGGNYHQQPTVMTTDPYAIDGFGMEVVIRDRRLLVGAPADDEIGPNAGSVAVFRWYAANLVITKSDQQATAVPGEIVTYTISANNPTGPDDVPDARVLDVFPADLVGCAWSCTPAGGATCTANGIGDIDDAVDLPVGGQVTYTANCIVAPSATGTVTNTATIDAPTVVDPFPVNNTATDVDTLTPEADLSITKSNGRNEMVESFSYPYTITAMNPGPSDAPNTTVSDTFPPELTDCTWTCTPSGFATCTASGTGDINDTVFLAVGASVAYTATCTVAASSGTCTNTASITPTVGLTDPNPANDSATDADHITALADWIFSDGFETGDSIAWSNTVP